MLHASASMGIVVMAITLTNATMARLMVPTTTMVHMDGDMERGKAKDIVATMVTKVVATVKVVFLFASSVEVPYTQAMNAQLPTFHMSLST